MIVTRPKTSESLPDYIEPNPYKNYKDNGKFLSGTLYRAKRANKMALINFGANWCPDARALCAMFQLSSIQNFINTHFEVIAINVGRYDQNMDLVNKMGLTDGLEGVPTLLVIHPDGHLMNAESITFWRTARNAAPQKLLDYLYDHIQTGRVPSCAN